MALFYAFVLERRLWGRPLLKTLIYGTAVWLCNSLFVLPLTGEGLAGSRHLTSLGRLQNLGVTVQICPSTA